MVRRSEDLKIRHLILQESSPKLYLNHAGPVLVPFHVGRFQDGLQVSLLPPHVHLLKVL